MLDLRLVCMLKCKQPLKFFSKGGCDDCTQTCPFRRNPFRKTPHFYLCSFEPQDPRSVNVDTLLVGWGLVANRSQNQLGRTSESYGLGEGTQKEAERRELKKGGEERKFLPERKEIKSRHLCRNNCGRNRMKIEPESLMAIGIEL